MIVRNALETTRQRLNEAQIPAADTDARILLAEAIGERLASLPAVLRRPMAADSMERLDGMLKRRLSREPLPYITGETEFMGLRLHCDRRALVPRPETESVVEAAVETIEATIGVGDDAPAVIADIGTGSGCIAIAIADHFDTARIIATDVSGDAVDLASENAARHDLLDRITFVHGRDLQPLFQADSAAQVDAIVCNPPYCAEDDYDELAREITDYEPAGALLAGNDGLEFYRRVLPRLQDLPQLKLVVFEFGINQSVAVHRLASVALPAWQLQIRDDLSGRPRVLVATHRC